MHNASALKEQFELIRGEPIQAKVPSDAVPCIETSDKEKLCRNPVVSVHMLTYNHEPYIRQAIEGVMMQKTDFEYELIIGEDASTDKTREICFEYQKKYPDKIRVLWSENNVFAIGGNGTRVSTRCRGEFIAFCEGDDYWTDPCKLQKQVDAFRANPTVGICIAGARILNQGTGEFSDYGITAFPEGFVKGKEFFRIHGFGGPPADFIMTATVMVRRNVYEELHRRYEIFKWRLYVGDTTVWQGMSTISDAYVLYDSVAVYRRTNMGATVVNGARTGMDGALARVYYCVEHFNIPLQMALAPLANAFVVYIFHLTKLLSSSQQRTRARQLLKNDITRRFFKNPLSWPGLCLMLSGLLGARMARISGQIVYHLGKWHGKRTCESFVSRYFR